jgi:hypothetical protein
MHEPQDAPSHVTYVVPVSRDGSGTVQGVVVRVTTGERVEFCGADAAARRLREMLTADMPEAEPVRGEGSA